MGIAIASFFSGTPLYRLQKPAGSPLTRTCQVLVASFHKWNLEVPSDSNLLYETRDESSSVEGSRKLEHTDELKCLDRASVISETELKTGDFTNQWRLCTVTQVEELKILIRVFPIWATGILFAAVYAQMSTMFVEQGMLMDATVGSFKIPPASLSTFDVVSVIFWVPIYDALIVPLARKFTGNPRGFTELQRMGIRLLISIPGMPSSRSAVSGTNRTRSASSGRFRSICLLVLQRCSRSLAGSSSSTSSLLMLCGVCVVL